MKQYLFLLFITAFITLFASEKMIVDNADILAKDKRLMKMYKLYNKNLLKEFDIDFRVATTKSKADINIFANQMFAKLQKDTKSSSGKALLLVINPQQDRVRLEVSMALEGIYTDAFVSYIERKGFVPYFRDNKILDGVYMALELVRDRAYEAKQHKEFVPAMKSRSIGAGAKTKAFINTQDKNAKSGKSVPSSQTDTPKDILNKYIASLKAHNKNPNLEIYTNSTKKFFAKHTVTDINQNNEVKFLKNCMNTKETLYSDDGVHAVMLNDPEEQRTCTPHFFKKEQGIWRLDIATMAQILRFNGPMQWHFDMQKRLQGEAMYYAFAFQNIRFNFNGFPFKTTQKERKDETSRWGFMCSSWYVPGSDIKNHPDENYRCWIKRVWAGSPAHVRLGLDEYDYIFGVGRGSKSIKNVSYKGFMNYMKSVPSGDIASVIVIRDNKLIVKEGIAP